MGGNWRVDEAGLLLHPTPTHLPSSKTSVILKHNMDDLILEYFSIEPHSITWDGQGRQIKIPCDIPSIAGFCALHNVTPKELRGLISERTAELCQVKMEHILIVNGLNRGYDSGLTALLAKNKLGYTDKTEITTTRKTVLSDADRRMLERAGVSPVLEVVSERVM